MIISKWLKKYNTSDYLFVTYPDGEQALIVTEGDDLLNPVDVKTGKEANCFGYTYVLSFAKAAQRSEKRMSLIKAKLITKKMKLYDKYAEFVKKVKIYEKQTGERYTNNF